MTLRSSRPGSGVARATGSALTPWQVDGEWRHTQVEMGAEACRKGSDRPLTGVLFAYLDVVLGTPPTGVVNPTVDLQVRLFSAPRCGTVGFRARTLRLGRSLYVGEAEMRQGDGTEPFGIATATFVNKPVPFPERSAARGGQSGSDGGGGRYSRLTGTSRIAPGILELHADVDTPQGTVGGAILGRLIEAAAVDLSESASCDELDVRFLNKVKAGPLRTAATVLGRRDSVATVRVEVRDSGHGNRLVTYGLAVCHLGTAP